MVKYGKAVWPEASSLKRNTLCTASFPPHSTKLFTLTCPEAPLEEGVRSSFHPPSLFLLLERSYTTPNTTLLVLGLKLLPFQSQDDAFDIKHESSSPIYRVVF